MGRICIVTTARKKIQLFTTLTMDKPILLDEKTIELVIHNQSQNNLLQEEKQRLMDYLRKQLNNFQLQLLTRIEERAGTDDVAYTNKERYLKMVEKNPDLEEFRKQLGLELELKFHYNNTPNKTIRFRSCKERKFQFRTVN